MQGTDWPSGGGAVVGLASVWGPPVPHAIGWCVSGGVSWLVSIGWCLFIIVGVECGVRVARVRVWGQTSGALVVRQAHDSRAIRVRLACDWRPRCVFRPCEVASFAWVLGPKRPSGAPELRELAQPEPEIVWDKRVFFLLSIVLFVVATSCLCFAVAVCALLRSPD